MDCCRIFIQFLKQKSTHFNEFLRHFFFFQLFTVGFLRWANRTCFMPYCVCVWEIFWSKDNFIFVVFFFFSILFLDFVLFSPSHEVWVFALHLLKRNSSTIHRIENNKTHEYASEYETFMSLWRVPLAFNNSVSYPDSKSFLFFFLFLFVCSFVREIEKKM